jgi:hypothetical protein
MIKVKQEGHENLETRIHPNETEHLILVSKDQLQKNIDDENLWSSNQFIMDLSPCQKIAVEAYYCGFLEYYGEHARSDMIQHDIHFDWKVEGKKSVLKVYLWPAPVRKQVVGKFTENKNANESSFASMSPPPATTTTDPPAPKGPPPPPLS